MMRTLWLSVGVAALVLAATPSIPRAAEPISGAQRAQQLVAKASGALGTFLADENLEIPGILGSAVAVIIVPEYIRAGIGIGGEAGSGILLKKETETGSWSGPAFIDLHGASIGPQIGYQKGSVLLVIENEATLAAILRGTVTLGADIGYDAGTAHAHTVASGSGKPEQGLQIFSRGEGVFAGATVKGMVVRPNRAFNIAYYAEGASIDRILTNDVAANAGSNELRALLSRVAGAEVAERR